jgi:hypothetical protein
MNTVQVVKILLTMCIFAAFTITNFLYAARHHRGSIRILLISTVAATILAVGMFNTYNTVGGLFALAWMGLHSYQLITSIEIWNNE